MLVASAVGVLVSVYAIGYARRSGRVADLVGWRCRCSCSACSWCRRRRTPSAFLLAWELMAAGLDGAGPLRPGAAARRCARRRLWYTAMTQLSFVLLLAGHRRAGRRLRVAPGSLRWPGPAPARTAASLAFVLLVLGFATKAGLVPLHVWLPRAHSEAPSHVSAAMSAAMVTMGVYGALLVTVRLLPGGPAWWGLVLLALGAVSALYGILQASVASDVKRLLAYSTTENVGLMFVALGTWVLLRPDGGCRRGADVALTACLLLVVSHAAFKATLFLGGRRRCCTRPGAGPRPARRALRPAHALDVAAPSGWRPSGRPRCPSPPGSSPSGPCSRRSSTAHVRGDRVSCRGDAGRRRGHRAHRRPGAAHLRQGVRDRVPGPAAVRRAQRRRTRRRPPCGGAGGRGRSASCVLGLAARPVAVALAADGRAPEVPGPSASAGSTCRTCTRCSTRSRSRSWPVAVVRRSLVAVVALGPAPGIPAAATDLAWGCGGARVSPRMQYTATSYAEPLVRVFDDVLAAHPRRPGHPRRRVRGTSSSGWSTASSSSTSSRSRLYRPVLRPASAALGVAARRLQNGSIHRYLGLLVRRAPRRARRR